jgi:hypothetical protein
MVGTRPPAARPAHRGRVRGSSTTSASTRLSVSGTTSRPASAPTAVIPAHARRRRSPVDWLVAPAPPARLAVLRILVGVYATAWAVVRLPAHLAHTDRVAARWQPVGILAPLESPPADTAILLLAVAAPLLGVLFVAGWRYRAIGPLFAVAMLLLATLDSSWGQVFHTEHLLVLHLLILAVAPAADVLATGRRRPPPGPTVDGRYGWPVRLTAVVVVLTYMIAGIAKLRIGGLDWLDGDTLRNWVAHDNLRKAVLGDTYSPIGRHLVRHAWLFSPIAVLTVIVELGAWVALLGGRWRTASDDRKSSSASTNTPNASPCSNSPEHQVAEPFCLGAELCDQARLADPLLTDDLDDTLRPRLEVNERLPEHVQLAAPPHQDRRGLRHDLTLSPQFFAVIGVVRHAADQRRVDLRIRTSIAHDHSAVPASCLPTWPDVSKASASSSGSSGSSGALVTGPRSQPRPHDPAIVRRPQVRSVPA